MVRLARSQPNQDIALAPQSSVRKHRHEQGHTAGAHLHVEAPEGVAIVDKEDRQAALNPSRLAVHGRRDVQNKVTSSSGFGHGEGLASGNGSSRAVSGDQGTWDVHGDLQGAILISESFSSPNPIHTPSTPAAASFEGAGGEGGGGVAGFATGSLT